MSPQGGTHVSCEYFFMGHGVGSSSIPYGIFSVDHRPESGRDEDRTSRRRLENAALGCTARPDHECRASLAVCTLFVAKILVPRQRGVHSGATRYCTRPTTHRATHSGTTRYCTRPTTHRATHWTTLDSIHDRPYTVDATRLARAVQPSPGRTRCTSDRRDTAAAVTSSIPSASARANCYVCPLSAGSAQSQRSAGFTTQVFVVTA